MAAPRRSPADEWFAHVAPALAPTARTVRRFVLSAAPTLEESMKWGHPCYSDGGVVLYIAEYADHLNLGFYRGAHLDDSAGLLEGTGKGLRHLKVRSEKDLSTGVRRLIRLAVEESHAP